MNASTCAQSVLGGIIFTRELQQVGAWSITKIERNGTGPPEFQRLAKAHFLAMDKGSRASGLKSHGGGVDVDEFAPMAWIQLPGCSLRSRLWVEGNGLPMNATGAYQSSWITIRAVSTTCGVGTSGGAVAESTANVVRSAAGMGPLSSSSSSLSSPGFRNSSSLPPSTKRRFLNGA